MVSDNDNKRFSKRMNPIISNRKTKRRSPSAKKSLYIIPPAMVKKYDELSPFELKDKLMSLAASSKKPMLNAGRGNPNFFNVFVREIFAKLQVLVMKITETKKHLLHDLDVYPGPDEFNYDKLFRKGVKKWNKRHRDFFVDYMTFIKDKCKEQKKNYNHMLHDLLLSTIGCFYPVPPQMQPHLNFASQEFMYDMVIGSPTGHGKEEGYKLKPTDFEFFATEGAAAGILYVFNTLKENYLLKPGDTIAIITPIFSPYLEMPRLADYDLNIVELKGNPEKNYALDDDQIDKLRDKKVKGLFMVNPSNPGAYSLPKENIDTIGHLINTERPDIFVLSDSVYAPFARKYNSFMLSCPKNTIEVYSLSKYFGTTGWRLGLVMMPKDTNLNKMIKNISATETKALHKRYSLATTDPEKLSFMDRIVFDSRQVAEAHVGGLSTPQQVLIGLFLFYHMHDSSHNYQHHIQDLLEKRMRVLYEDLKTQPRIVPESTDYYTLLDIPAITENLYGKSARDTLEKKYSYLEFMFHLANKYQTIMLPGKGFGTTNNWILRACLANLPIAEYSKISKNLASCIHDFVGNT